MTPRLAAGLGLALASAGALNWGFFAQHAAASALPALTLRRPLLSLRRLFADRRWLVGFVAGIGGWLLYVGALALAPLSLVQAASAGGIGLLALLVSHRAALAPRERRAVWLSIVGLALLGVSLTGQTGHGGAGSTLAVAVWVGVSLAVAGFAAVPNGVVSRAAGLGAAAGILYAAGDVATKAAVQGGSRLAFVPVLLACHGLAFVALQLGFQRGGALATAGVATLFTNALPIAAGTLVFGEGLGSLPVVRALAFVCTVLGAALLARPGAGEAVALPLPVGPVRFD